MTESHITSLQNAIEFLEVHEGLMKQMLSIKDTKFTLHSHVFSSSILLSLDKRRAADHLDSATFETVRQLMGKVWELEDRMRVFEEELKAKMKMFEESRGSPVVE